MGNSGYCLFFLSKNLKGRRKRTTDKRTKGGVGLREDWLCPKHERPKECARGEEDRNREKQRQAENMRGEKQVIHLRGSRR